MALALGLNLEKTRSYWIPSWDTHVELTGVSCDAARSLWWPLALRAPLQVNTQGSGCKGQAMHLRNQHTFSSVALQVGL